MAESGEKRFAVAVVGATGLVGEALLTTLEERDFPLASLKLLASERSEGESLVFGKRSVMVEALEEFDFANSQIVFFCTPAAVSARHARRAVAAGCMVIDASSQFRSATDVPLVAMDVNVSELSDTARLVAGPSAPAMQLATVLAPLQRAVGLSQVSVVTTLAVSARGRAGVNELAMQTARLLNVQSIDHKIFPAQIAFNSMPSFDDPRDSGYTLEESQISVETRRLLGDEQLSIDSSCLYAPVFYGHTQIIHLITQQPITAAKARTLLNASSGIARLKRGSTLSPVGGATDRGAVILGRICQSKGRSDQLTLWSVADNVHKGAAVNSVLVAENLIKSHA